MKIQLLTTLMIAIMTISACSDRNDNANTSAKESSILADGSFGYDLQFLKERDTNLVVLSDNNSRIIVSPKYQAKVFTSTNDGDSGRSFGWVHYKAFDGAPDPHMNAYGGEDRLWLGPEGGKFSLFFKGGSKMEFPGWKTPAAFDTEPWAVTEKSDRSVTMQKVMNLENYAGTMLSLLVNRSVSVLDNASISRLLKIDIDSSVQVVGYATENILTNKGNNEWTEQTGMPCLWLLDMFPPSDSTTIIIPFGPDPKISNPATTNYFGEIPDSRIKIKDSVLFFRADGKMRGKLGMHPRVAKNIIGSYDALHHILTIALFDIDNNARYLNQEWNTEKPPFSGDAVNAYNDGPLANGSQMGPFYEIESVSPAAFLKPGKSLTHNHSVFHFTAPEEKLNSITEKLLGVSIEKIKTAF